MQLSTLESVTEIIGGGTPSRNEASYFGGEIPWATPTDVTRLQGMTITATKETITSAGLKNSSAKLLPAKSVLLTSRATIGFVAVSSVPMATNQGFINFVCGPELIPEYLARWLLTQKETLLSLAGGTTFKEVSKGNVRKMRIPVPPLDEQQRIVDILDRAASIQRRRQAADEKLKQIIPALFVDMFGDPASNPKGWPMTTVGDLIESADYGSSSKAHDEATGLPMLRMGNVTMDGALDMKNLKYVALEPAEQAKFTLKKGDILFNRTNSKELVGKTGIWDGSCDAVYASYFIRLRTKPELMTAEVLWAFMNSKHTKGLLFGMARGAIGQSNINSKELRAIRLFAPPIALQERFSQIYYDLKAKAAMSAAATNAATCIADSLANEVFSAA